MAHSARTVVLSANSDWNIANFRGGLVRGLKAAGYAPLVIAPEDPAADARMRSLEVERIAIPIERSGLNPAADAMLFARYRRLLASIRPAAYLSYTIKPNVYGAAAAAGLGIPAVPNVSGLGTAFLGNALLQRIVTPLYRWGFRRAPVVFFQNDEDRQLFLDRRIVRTSQARVLPGSGVDLQRFVPSPLPQGPPTFLLVGRLLRDKGVVEFVDAARLLKRRHPDARLQLLGPVDEGNRTAIGRDRLDAWVAEGLVDYLGATDDVRPFIERATAVVLPSYREGLPRSLLEASAIARPVIAADVPGCRQAVDDGTTGLLCAVRDPESLAAAMQRVAEAPRAALEAMGAAGREKVQRQFSEEFVVQAYLDVLAELESRR